VNCENSILILIVLISKNVSHDDDYDTGKNAKEQVIR